ncbi:MAG: nickel-dependent lactate racemase [Armatimonadetes bacterium]|nr:nickel-dependent lactate racemase [Armatimonadota bacterium]
MVRIEFPYPNTYMDIPESNLLGIFETPCLEAAEPEDSLIRSAIASPIGAPRLRELAYGKKSALIVCDDVARPTPAFKVIPHVIEELHAGGIADDEIEFMMALGTHRPMTEFEMRAKVGDEVFERYRVYNHAWDDPDALEFMGKTDQGVEVWINKKVAEAGIVIGIGRIMPIDVCGFSGGGKILVPGCCGEITNSEMHWTRTNVDSREIAGKRDNPIRDSIDALARKAGLDFIVNIVMDSSMNILDCVAGDLVEAHREGCRRARAYHEVRIPSEADIVVVDGHPFDIEFWQVNKAVDTAGVVVREGGAVICVSPCHEGLSATHADVLLEFGYRSREEIVGLVESGRISHKVVGVHMMQVSEVAVEKARLYMVTPGISREHIEKVGLEHASTPQEALDKALERLGSDAKVAVLRGAAEMLPIVG